MQIPSKFIRIHLMVKLGLYGHETGQDKTRRTRRDETRRDDWTVSNVRETDLLRRFQNLLFFKIKMSKKHDGQTTKKKTRSDRAAPTKLHGGAP